MADNEQIIRDALITLFEADTDTKSGGTLGVTKWWRRAEDGLFNMRTPFCYVEFDDRRYDEQSSDISNVGYFFNYKIGILAAAGSKDKYKADDKVTALMNKIEDVLLENRTVGSTVNDLAGPIEKEMNRGGVIQNEIYDDISWGIITVTFKKQINARQ